MWLQKSGYQMVNDEPLALIIEDAVNDEHVGEDQLHEVQLLAVQTCQRVAHANWKWS